MPAPWIINDHKFIPKSEADKKASQDRANAAKALAEQNYEKPKGGGGGLFSSAIGKIADVGTGGYDLANKIGLGNTVLSAISPLAGRNPVTDKITEYGMSGENTLGALGVDSSNLPESPRFPLRQAVDVGLAPANFVGIGVAAKGAKAAGLGVRGIGAVIGRQAAKDVAAGTAGYVAAQQVDKRLPENTPDIVREGIGLGTGLGVGAGVYKGAHVVPEALQGKGPLRSMGGSMMEIIDPKTRMLHGTYNYIPEGEMLVKPNGDLSAGAYFTRDIHPTNSVANNYVQGDVLNLNNIHTPEKIAEGSPQVYGFRAKHALFLLSDSENLTQLELRSIRNNLPEIKGQTKKNLQEQFDRDVNWAGEPKGQDARNFLMNNFGQDAFIDTMTKAGFDGMVKQVGDTYQHTIFKPNEVLEPSLHNTNGPPSKPLPPSSPIGGEPDLMQGYKKVYPNADPAILSQYLSDKNSGNTTGTYANWLAENGYSDAFSSNEVSPVKTNNSNIVDSTLDKLNQSKSSEGDAKTSPEAQNKIDIISGDIEQKWGSKYATSFDELATTWEHLKYEGWKDYWETLSDPVKKLILDNNLENDLVIHGQKPELDPTYQNAHITNKSGNVFDATKNHSYEDLLATWGKLLDMKKGGGWSAIAEKQLKEVEAAITKTADSHSNLASLTGKSSTTLESLKQSYPNAEEWQLKPYAKLIDKGYTNTFEEYLKGYKGPANSFIYSPEAKSLKSAYPNAPKFEIESYLELAKDGYKGSFEEYAYDTNGYDKELWVSGKNNAFKSSNSSKPNPVPTPVSPEEIVGIKPQTSFEDQLAAMPQSYEHKTYDPIGDPNAPVAGKGKPNIGAVDSQEKIAADFAKMSAKQKELYSEISAKKPQTHAQIMAQVEAQIPYEKPTLAPPGPSMFAKKKYGTVAEQLAAKPFEPGIDPNPMTVGEKSAKSYVTPEEAIANNKTERDSLSPVQQKVYDDVEGPHSYKMSVAKAAKEISGGAAAETLVTPREPGIGLTKGEKVGNVLTNIQKFIVGHGVLNNEVATPIAKEYERINKALKTQATYLGKQAQLAEHIIPMDENLNIDMSNLSPAQSAVAESLNRTIDNFKATLDEHGLKFKDVQDFADTVRSNASGREKRFSDILTEYGNSIANKVSDSWLKKQITVISDSIEAADEFGIDTPTDLVRVNGISSVKLPPEVGQVLSRAVKKVHPQAGSEAAQLFTAINNALRNLWATGDLSFHFIQNLPTLVDNPKLAGEVAKLTMQSINDPTTFAKWGIEHDRGAYGVRPTITKWIEHELHIAPDTGVGTDIEGLPGRVKNLPVVGKLIQKSDTAFVENGNFTRVKLADYLYDNWKNNGIINGLDVAPGASESEVLRSIAKAANRSTGYASKGLGGSLGSATLFAPRFLQSQLETIVKAFSDKGIEGQVARRQMIKLIAIGSGITVAANAARGEDTIFDPRDSNFMRIRNVKGADLSVFGPWDSLVRGLVRSVPHIEQNGDFTLGDPSYMVRSKLSPVLSIGVDLLKGENLIGDKVAPELPTSLDAVKNDASLLKNTTLPFSLRGVGDDPAVVSGAGFFGMKGAPLTGKEILKNTLTNNGIKENDPEYLIKKREYLASHPDDIPTAQGNYKDAQNVQQDISARRKLNDDKLTSGSQTLSQFRDNRKILLQEQRDKLSVLIKNPPSKVANTDQEKWLKSYFEIFKQNQDPITKSIDAQSFDKSVADWTNKNGSAALDFVNRYTGAGLSQGESTYFNDLRKLDAAGYFKMKKYTGMKSNLTEAEIDNINQQVQSARIANPALQKQSIAQTTSDLFKGHISNNQLTDVINSNKQNYQNPALQQFKDTHRQELMWFNPNADWNSYLNAKNKVPSQSSNSNFKLSGLQLKSFLK